MNWLNEMIKTQKEIEVLELEVVKHTTMIGATVLAVLLSLDVWHSDKSLLYLSGLVLLLLSVLIGIVYLYTLLITLRRLLRKMPDALKENAPAVFVKNRLITVFEIWHLLFLLSSFICLVLSVILD